MSAWQLSEKIAHGLWTVAATADGRDAIIMDYSGEPNPPLILHAILTSVLAEDAQASMMASPDGLITQDAIDTALAQAESLAAMTAAFLKENPHV